ncbi:unnamed protein product [Umbelopsis vinacea]
MVNSPTTKRQNENEASQAPQDSNGVDVSVEPFNPATSMKKRKTGNAVNVVKFAFEDTLINFAEEDQLDSKIENTEKSWARSTPPKLNPATDNLVFQQIEADEYMDYTINRPVVRFFGVTDSGNSVLCHVQGFLPYFYVPAPVGFLPTHVESFKRALISSLGIQGSIVNVEICLKQSIYGYHGNSKSPFIKIIVNDPKMIPKARAKLESGLSVPGYDKPVVADMTYESNLAYLLRFMIDCKVTGSNWIELPAGTYRMRHNTVSHTQIEVEVQYDKFISHPSEGEYIKIAPLRILSFDIECAGRKGVFPEPQMDPVIQIATVVKIQGESKPFIRNVFTLNSCAHIVGTHTLEFYDEKELLQKWRDFVTEIDPDVVVGYNTSNFDFPYLLDRAKHLGVDKFPFLGRIRGVKTEAKDTKFSSKAYGTRENKAINMEGRLQLDMLQVMQRDYKLRSYTLNSVCAQFLGEQKEDVHHSIITDLQNGNSDTRRRLAVYCLKASESVTLLNDAYLPLRLMDKLMCLYNYTEMARVTGIPFNYVLVRGQQIKVVSQLYRKSLEQDLVIPAIRTEVGDEQYEGATVIEPTKGYYDVPIATLDFSSLYPSIMQAHNLCYTTLVSTATVEKLNLVKDEDYIITPNNDLFVKSNRRPGLLPEILTELLAARKRAKADLKKETDPFKRAVLDGRQLALKISANSVYGFTGATIGKLPCLQISSSTTAYGRQMIMKTKQVVEDTFNIKNGYKHDAQVIYGDTDSVMIKFGVDNLEEAMELGNIASKIVTKEFIRPINLEFEKVYFPYLLINKKRYAGLYWTNPKKYDKLDSKGIETVRRDNCRLVQTVIETCLHKLLIDRDVNGAQEFVKRTIADLLQNKVDLSNLVITKALSKSDYAGKQAHVELAERMRQRDAGSAPALGDRVAYVIVKGANRAAAYEKSEDPIYVLENNIPIDTKYYLDNQLSKPLLRIFEPILGDKAESLLSGEHTRTVNISTPTVGGLMKFAVKTATCMGCKTPLPKGDNSAKFGSQDFGLSVKDVKVLFTKMYFARYKLDDTTRNDTNIIEFRLIRQDLSAVPSVGTPKPVGNLALSSCPGKKVRLSGPVRGRAAINRDLDLDFARLNRQFGITTIVCCLNDAELGFLGAPWPRYYELALRHNIEIIRLPMLEGSCPHTIEEIDAVIDLATEKMKRGENVLTHCRGGVGRAGLFACCWLLKNRFCHSAERAIRYVRLRRSPKSIETMRQAEFIIHYARYVNKVHEHRQREAQLASTEYFHHLQGNDMIPRYIALPEPGPPPLINTDISLTIPSHSQIASLEAQVTDTEPINPNLFANSQPPPPTIIARAHTSPSIMTRSHGIGIYNMQANEEILQPIYMLP